MALKQSGVQLVAGGVNKFITDMNKAAQTMLHFGATGQRLQSLTETASARIVRANDAIKASTERLNKAREENQKQTQIMADLMDEEGNIAQENAVKFSRAFNARNKALYDIYKASHEVELETMSLEAATNRLAAAETRERAVMLGRVAAMGMFTAAAIRQGGIWGGLGALIGTISPLGPGMGTAIGAQLGSMLGSILGQLDPLKLLLGLLGKLGSVLNQLLMIAGQVASGIVKITASLIGLAVAIAGKVLGAIKSLIGGFTSLIGKVLSPLTNFAREVLQIFAGLSLYSIFRKITEQIGQMANEMLDALSIFQRFEIQMRALIASDVSQQYGIPMAKALKMVSVQTQEALDWIIQLAVTTPFTATDISSTLALATAMGMTVEQAKELTVAIGNFTAGMGLTSENMYRIVYSMGQMISVGKLSAREFRDLANNMVPSYQILDSMADKAGIARDEFRKMAMEGGVPVMDFLKAFVEYSNTSFSGAMENMSKTWEGVRSNIKDFLQDVIGLQMFGPVFNRITSMMAEGLKKLMSPEVRETAKRIGQVLLTAFNSIVDMWNMRLKPALQELTRALGFPDLSTMSIVDVITNLTAGLSAGIVKISEFIKRLAGTFQLNWNNIAQSAYEWGSSIITQFAKGMVDALVEVANAIATIINYIAVMLEAMSPPKALPNIRKWGRAAMAEYMKGWTDIDFNTFKDIASTIESYLRSLGDIIPEKQLVPLILNMRVTVAQAINEIRKVGDITTATMEKIMKSAKYLPANFRTYLKALFAVEKATKAVKDAQSAADVIQERLTARQKELSAITDRYSKILDELNKQLDRNQEVYDDSVRLKEIDAAIATGLLTAEEKERLEVEKRDIALRAQIRTVEDQRDAEVEAQQAKVDAAQAAYDLAQAQVDLAQKQLDAAQAILDAEKSLIEVEIDNNNLVQEQIDLFKKLAEAAAGAASAISAVGTSTTDAGITIDTELTRWEKKYGEFGDVGISEMDRIKSNWSIAFQDIQKKIDDFVGGIGKSFEDLKKSVGATFDPLLGPTGAIENVKAAFQRLGEAIFGTPAGAGAQGVTGGKQGIFGKLSDAVKDVKDRFGELYDKLTPMVVTFDMIARGVGSIAKDLISIVDTISKVLFGKPTGGNADFWGIVASFVTWQAQVLLGMTVFAKAVVSEINRWASNMAGDISIVGAIQNLMEMMYDPWQQYNDDLIGNSLIPDLGDGINKIMDEKLGIVVDTTGSRIDEMIAKFTLAEPRFYAAGESDIEQVSQGMSWGANKTTGLLTNVQKIINDVIAVFESTANTQKFYNVGKGMVEGITAGLKDQGAWQALYNRIIEIVDKAIAAAKKEAQEESPSKRMARIGENLGIGLALGIQRSSALVRASLNGLVGGRTVSAGPVMGATSIDRSVHITMNPSYANYQSPSSVYFDVAAALAAAGR